MASQTDIFNHSTAQVFSDEAPTNSSTIGGRILDRTFDAIDAILVSKYGVKATLPLGQSNPAAIAAAQQQQNASMGGGAGLLLILAFLFILFFTRK